MANDKKTWVVMIYMAADNDLSDEGVWALTEIQDVDLTDERLGVVALYDSRVKGLATTAFQFGYGKSAAPFTVLPAKNSNQVDLGNFDLDSTGDVLKNFVIAVQDEYPADHYMLVLSGHGSGAIGDFLKGGAAFTGVSIPELGEKLGAACNQDIDILGMDSCVMSMAEVCCELQDSIKWLVGSEGFDPSAGWPYKEILLALQAYLAGDIPQDPNALRSEVAKTIVDKYIEFYQPYIAAGTSVDMSACDLGKYSQEGKDIDRKEALMNAVEKLALVLTGKIDDKDKKVQNAVILSHWRAQSYKKNSYTDLWDFCNLLGNCFELGSSIHKCCEEVKTAVADMVFHSRYYGAAFQHSHGISIYFPWSDSDEMGEYANLKFSVGAKWGGFLRKYVNVTKRERRGEGAKDEEAINIPATEDEATVVVQVHKLNAAPGRLNAAPGRLNAAPGRLGLIAKSASMKNPPDGFYINSITRQEIP